MPTIRLKPNSADYADDCTASNAQPHECEFDGCALKGIHKAPKHRGLNEFYHFCTAHITTYNKGWNFFDGMNAGEVQDHMERARYGDRPTWRSDTEGRAEERLRKKAWHYANFSNDSDDESPNKEKRGAIHGFDPASAEFEAMALFGLEPPTSLIEIKKRYKELAMKHHPDRNNGCLKSEELLKQINMGYTVLKTAYEKFDTLQDK